MTNSFSTPLARRKSVSNAEMNTLKAGTKEQSNSATMSKGKNFLLNMKFGSGSHSNKTNNNSEGHPSTSGVTKNSNNIAVPDKDKDKTIQVDNNKEEGNHSNKGGDNEESVYLRNWKNVPYIDVPNSQSGNETPGRYDDSNGGCVFIDSDSSAVDAIDAADALIIRSPRLEGQMSLSNDDSGGISNNNYSPDPSVVDPGKPIVMLPERPLNPAIPDKNSPKKELMRMRFMNRERRGKGGERK
eukprot:CAMPEP_0175084846 /NCGR_PEP_ID=MMETSP0052_2-20121109/28304_1 /TAXON_ID=51329 ORGANISM="Polytomella parva, Strain SAG 63-3" /NCGR_SAMPLE_ID=MMETSP0052_2 /ASSEMBLY_ACC=CAM_ASM_000194 /LENGTH=241 /DNA_ID=CAMNT_0016356731 /DNA_START=28 /DNA_END=753 /DNA_ORIENTATION=-